MDSIPMPQVLDADRLLLDDRSDFVSDHEARAKVLAKALRDSCDYGARLWRELDAVRQYLLDSAPQNPDAQPGPPRAGARPTGPADDEGWAAWSTAYASVTSLLAGPNKDSGYGEQEAHREERFRRLPAR